MSDSSAGNAMYQSHNYQSSLLVETFYHSQIRSCWVNTTFSPNKNYIFVGVQEGNMVCDLCSISGDDGWVAVEIFNSIWRENLQAGPTSNVITWSKYSENVVRKVMKTTNYINYYRNLICHRDRWLISVVIGRYNDLMRTQAHAMLIAMHGWEHIISTENPENLSRYTHMQIDRYFRVNLSSPSSSHSERHYY